MIMHTKLRFEAPPIYFLHIPKTAGVSLRVLLSSAYAKREVLALFHPWELAQVSPATLQSYRCYLCHYGIGLYDLVGRTDLISITMLRDPVERAVSSYYFHQRKVRELPHQYTPEYLQRVAATSPRDIPAWLAIPELRSHLENRQTRELGIAYDYRPYVKGGSIASRVTSLRGPLSPTAPVDTTDMAQAAATARQRLEAMTIVGLTERFDESVEMICGMLGIPIPVKTLRANLGPQKKDVDIHRYRRQLAPDLLEQLEALNTYDQELYRCACELFEQQLARFRATPQRTYSIAPRLLMPVRKRIRAAWRKATQDRPAIARHPFVQGAKSWIKRWA
jgi:hypothetical protein